MQFFYYPEKNVYYDPVKRSFWYSLNGTKSWSTFTDTNFFDPIALGQKVVINSSNPKVYKENDNHRKLYAGKLYTINTTDTAVAANNTTEAVERVIVQKKRPLVVKKQISNKPKSNNSIGKIISKIFGKHK